MYQIVCTVQTDDALAITSLVTIKNVIQQDSALGAGGARRLDGMRFVGACWEENENEDNCVRLRCLRMLGERGSEACVSNRRAELRILGWKESQRRFENASKARGWKVFVSA